MILSKYINATLVNAIRQLTVVCFGKADVRTANECAPFGTDSSPIAGMSAVYASTSSDKVKVIIGYVNTNQLAQAGEYRIYATDADGNEACRIWLHNDGSLELGGTGAAGNNTNHATQFEALNAALQGYVENINTQLTLIETAINALAPGTFPDLPVDISCDISAAKLNNIKTE